MHTRTIAGVGSGPIVRTVRFIRGSVKRAHHSCGIDTWDAPVVDEHPLVLVARKLAVSNICELFRHTGPQRQKTTKRSNEGGISCILRISGERQRPYTFTIPFRIEDTLHFLRALYPPSVLLRWSYPARSQGPFRSRCRTHRGPSTLLLYFCDGATPHALRVLFGRDAEHTACPLPSYCTSAMELPRTL